MRKDFGSKTFLYPMPVLVVAAYGEDGTPNAMTAAWGGIYDTQKIGMCLSAGHKTTKNIFEKKAFTVSMATEATVAMADYVGIVSGNEVPDKLEKCGMKTEKSSFVDAPVPVDFPLTLECEFESYDTASGYLVGKIVNISADESVLTEGKIDVQKLRPVTYDEPGLGYVVLGEKVAAAYSVGKQFK